jgi:peptidyl-prolyl cis-trans isomerase SurA
MTLRISQFAVVCGLSLLALPGVVQAQAPRYQSPLSVPATPEPQLTLPTPPAITPNGAVVEDVIVRVNDQIISRSDVERSEQQLAQDVQQAGGSSADLTERQKNLLRDMIDQQLLLSRAKELGLNADAEVIRRLDEIRKQNHMDSMEDLEKAARQQGVSFEDFKANIRNGVLTQQVVREEVGSHLQMTQSQEQGYYEAHKQEFSQPEQVKLSEILVPTPADATDAVIAQAKAKADDIAAKIAAGGKFDELAKTYSGGPTAAQGGDLGLFKRGALAKVLEDQTFDLKVTEVTAPIRTRQGFVILKVTDHQAAGIAPLKDVEQQVQEAMYMEQMQPALRAYLTKLREEAYIEIKEGFVDSGASPRQTKPVFSAYAAPAPKKVKKVQEKKRFDRGGHYSTVSETAPVATPVAATTTTTKNGKTVVSKPKKIKKEKVRLGQAPRNSLPEGPQEAAVVGGDTGAGAASAAVTPGGTMAAGAAAAAAPAPGTAIAPLSSSSQVAANSDVDSNPLDPKAAAQKKTRFSDRAKTQSLVSPKAKPTKTQLKAATAPAPITTEEKAAQKTQAAPLGLNGDTAKKTKKKKQKGAQKERLQDKPAAPAAAPPPETPSKAPDRGTAQEGILPPVKPAATPAPAPAPDTAPTTVPK